MPGSRQIPMVSYLRLDDGAPYLTGFRCASCEAIFFDRRNACARCGRRRFDTVPVATTGTLTSFTIVHRAAPKVPAPYASAVVQLDDGAVIKANLVGVPCDPDQIPLGGRVRLVTFVAGADDDGTEAVAFGFTPQEGD